MIKNQNPKINFLKIFYFNTLLFPKIDVGQSIDISPHYYLIY